MRLYFGKSSKRTKAMLRFIGIWKDRPSLADPETYIRLLRRGTRLRRLAF